MNAFVAFGGDESLKGEIRLSDLTQRIADDFQLEVNVKKLLEAQDIDKSGKIDFNEFRSLVLK